MVSLLVVDFFGQHGIDVKRSISSGYGDDISNRVEVFSEGSWYDDGLQRGMAYAKENKFDIVVCSMTGASSYVSLAEQYYPDVALFIPAGANFSTKVFSDSIPQKLIVTGGGDEHNETGYYIEFFSNDPLTPESEPDEQDLSSFSNGYIAGQIAFIMDAVGCGIDEARERARATGSRGGAWDEVDGYGVIDVRKAADLDLGSFGNVSFDVRRDYVTLYWEVTRDSDVYNVYRRAADEKDYTLIGATTGKVFNDYDVTRKRRSYLYKIGMSNGGYTERMSAEVTVPFLRVDGVFAASG